MSADEIFIVLLLGVCIAVVTAMAVYSRRTQVSDAVAEAVVVHEVERGDVERPVARRQRRAR